MQHVYIYYRIDPAQAETAAHTVDTLLTLLTPHCATPPRRLTRCADPELWMEVYEGITDVASFTRHIDEAMRLLGCHRFIEGERHQESFCIPQRHESLN